MQTSNKGLVELVGHEGICLRKYRDSVGVWTIGIGATRSEIPDLASWPLTKEITIQEAFDLLSTSIRKYEAAINNNLKRAVPQYQFDALVSWCYNVGVGWVGKSSVMKLLNQGADGGQLYNALMLYNKPKEILNRRKKEAILLSLGKYSNDGKALLFPVSSKGYPIYGKGVTVNVWEYLDKKSEELPPTVNVNAAVEKHLETKPSILDRILYILTGNKR